MPGKRLRLQRNIKANESALIGADHRSVEERMHYLVGELVREANELEDLALRDLWMDGIDSFIKSGDFNEILEVTKWRRVPVDPEEFLYGEAYLHQKRNEIFPGLEQAYFDLDTDEFSLVVEKGSLGIGKTFLANTRMCRDIYKISCMRDPQSVYGLSTGSPIVFTIQSIRLSTAKKVVFGEFGRFIKDSPYFQQKYPFNPLVQSEMQFREQNLIVMPVSSAGNAVISMNVLGGQLDEANFLQKNLHSKSQHADDAGVFDQAKQLFTTLSDRRKSRFLEIGSKPGALYLISSSRFPDDYTEIKARESVQYGGKDPSIYVYEGSQWEIKGRDKFAKEDFTVQIGNESFPSKVIEPGDVPNVGCEIIQVPMNFINEFRTHPDDSLRNFAGLTTLSTKPFLTQRQMLASAVELATKNGYVNPFGREEIELSGGIPKPDRAKFRLDVKMPRACHIDLGHKKDACGFAVAHIAGHKIEETMNEETGKKDVEIKPVIAYDVVMRIVAPLGGEIQFFQVRQFLIKLRDVYGLDIKWVTFDGFQSIDSRQLLQRRNFQAGYQSVEGVEPWRSWRDALYDGRILFTQHNFAQKEFAELETTSKNNKEKIDHRPDGTKDVADAMVGAATTLMTRRSSWQTAQYSGARVGMFMIGEELKFDQEAVAPTDDKKNAQGPRKRSLRKTIARPQGMRK